MKHLSIADVERLTEPLYQEDRGSRMLGIVMIVCSTIILLWGTFVVGQWYERRAVREEIISKLASGKVQGVVLERLDLYVQPESILTVQRR